MLALQPDVLVLSEASNDPPDGWSSVWVGRNPAKGLAVFGRPGLTIAVHPAHDPAWEWFLPVTIGEDRRFTLLAAWAMNHRGSGPLPRHGRTLRAISAYADLLAGGECLAVGDFNNNVFWDTPHRQEHADIVALFAELGYASLYHEATGEAQGEENTPTFYWYRHVSKPYQIDYCFVPVSRLSASSLEVGAPEDWLARSDHMPLVVDLEW